MEMPSDQTKDDMIRKTSEADIPAIYEIINDSGIGDELLKSLYQTADKPVLIGTWAAAVWAVRFYEKNGFVKVSYREKRGAVEKILENTGTTD